jgi:hypothetical protein
MSKHTLLRAYLAGIAVPTVFLLVVMTTYTILREIYGFPVPIERVIVFPMAIVPNMWGLWNVLYVAFLSKHRFPLGLYGCALVFVVSPLGFLLARVLDVSMIHYFIILAPLALPVGLAMYYLAWKYLVGFLNAELGIAQA